MRTPDELIAKYQEYLGVGGFWNPELMGQAAHDMLGEAMELLSALAAPPQTPRPPQHIIDLAIQVSTWSPCRSKRGVVIFSGENIVTHGYNYKPRGFDCDGSAECKATCAAEAVHGEQQALMSAGTRAAGADLLHVKTVDGALVASGGPSCVQCSKLTLAAGVSGVWLYHESGWHRYEAIDFHRASLDASPVVATPDPQTVPQLADKVFAELHERAGVCGHCGKRKCLQRKSWSSLPDTLKTSDVLAAVEVVDAALCPETPQGETTDAD